MPNNLKRLLSFVVTIVMFITAIPLTVCGTGTSSATYTANGEYMTGVTDSRGNTTEYTYNESRGYVDYVTNAKDVTTDYTYNASELLTTVTVNDSSVSYTYDNSKRLSTITSPSGTVYTFTYDSFGRVVSTKINTSRTLSTNAYNEKGLLTSMTYGNGANISYGYDEFNRQNKLYVNGTLKAEYVYDGSSRVVEVRDVTGDVTIKYTYDILGRLVNERVMQPSTLTVLSRIDLRYDNTKNRIAGYDVTINGNSHSIDYVYGSGFVSPDLVVGVKLNGNQILSYEYDALNRISTRTLSATTTPHITAYTYLDGADETKTTTLIGTVTSGNDVYTYTYDELGNILTVTKNGTLVESYMYDELNQLTSATIGADTYTYTYDNGGNILSEKKNGTTTKSYVYGDATWKDLLTSYNGQTITYDAIGNPIEYRDDMSFTWSDGRKLTGAMLGASEYEYQYGTDGLRTQKNINGETTTYTWLNGILYAEETANYTLLYFYDDEGRAIGFTYKTSTTESNYYYVYNLQGDVVGILDSNGTQVVSYTYDVWGKVLSITGTLANTIGNVNPIRYRGYYYDYETGFYYLQTRYYDPIIGRFINADEVISETGGELLGYNVFAYCFNNPVNMFDDNGEWPSWKDIKAGAKKAVKWVDNNVIKPATNVIKKNTQKVATTAKQTYKKAKECIKDVCNAVKNNVSFDVGISLGMGGEIKNNKVSAGAISRIDIVGLQLKDGVFRSGHSGKSSLFIQTDYVSIGPQNETFEDYSMSYREVGQPEYYDYGYSVGVDAAFIFGFHIEFSVSLKGIFSDLMN